MMTTGREARGPISWSSLAIKLFPVPLAPSSTTSTSALARGVVLEPDFIPGLTLTADYWHIRQTGLDPAGKIDFVIDNYLNLDSRTSKGLDFGLFYRVPDFGLGNFRLRLNAARLIGFVQDAGPDGQEIVDAVAAGTLPLDVAGST